MNKGLQMATGDVVGILNSDDFYTSEDALQTIADPNMTRFMPAHPSFYCKKDCYGKYGYFDTSFKIAADFENLLRLIFIGRIKTRYIKKDFVTMRTGGASTAGFSSRRTIMKEHLQGFKKNGIYSNAFLLSLRYFYKIYEVVRG